jgi:hypothetical protein
MYTASVSSIVSFRQSTWNNSALTGWIFVKFYTVTNNDVDHMQISYNQTEISRTLEKGLRIFQLLSRTFIFNQYER